MERRTILVLGGTGAIGAHLVDFLKGSEYSVVVTSRKDRPSTGNINYVKGNAHDFCFLKHLLDKHYVAIVNFMTYSTDEFSKVAPMFLKATDQYFFLSSCRTYANSNELLSEKSPQLLDVCKDEEYLKTDNYALAKARQERVLINNGLKGWTIVRPYLTYSEQRLQLGFFEQGAWLMRAIKGKSIVFSEDLASKYTTLTYGKDVARAIVLLIGNERAIGETFNITYGKSILWSDVLSIYLSELTNITGRRTNLKMIPKAPIEEWPTEKWTYKYDRILNRRFSNAKLLSILDGFEFTELEEGLRHCIGAFYNKPFDAGFSWATQAKFDQITREWSIPREFTSKREYLLYLKYRVLSGKAIQTLRSIKHKIQE